MRIKIFSVREKEVKVMYKIMKNKKKEKKK